MNGVSLSRDDAQIAHQSSASDYFELLKPRVMSLVVFSAIAGIVMAPGSLHPYITFLSVLMIALGAGAAGALNMWYDRDIDRVMSRTKNRPIPMGKIMPDDALFFGIVLTIVSVGFLGLATNWVAASLLLFASFFYVVIYTTYLKRRTAQNIVIGGAAGAFPPMIGWAAVTGEITVESLILFAIIFMWTPPHFWALALYKCKDYERVGIPMMPNVAGESSTKKQMLVYTLLLWPITLAPYFLDMVSFYYVIGASLLNLLFTASAVAVLLEKQGYDQAKKMFGFSILYLFLIFTFMMIF